MPSLERFWMGREVWSRPSSTWSGRVGRPTRLRLTELIDSFRNVAQKPSGNASQLIDSQSKNHTTTIE